jgi:hypothetical protein
MNESRSFLSTSTSRSRRTTGNIFFDIRYSNDFFVWEM